MYGASCIKETKHRKLLVITGLQLRSGEKSGKRAERETRERTKPGRL